MVGVIGLFAGVLGGMLGIGGSILMIPGLVALFGDGDGGSLHVYQAAAMAVNIAVAAPATMRHRRAGALRRDLLQGMIPAAAVMIVVGVFVANATPTRALRMLFAVFLLFVTYTEARKLRHTEDDEAKLNSRVTLSRSGGVGGVMGSIAGLLGVGGGVVAVPLAQFLCRVSLREAIAASAATMCLTAGVGATVKMLTLGSLGLPISRALFLALALAPTAILGAGLGARMTHRLPIHVVRGVLIVVLLAAAGRMAIPS